MRKRTDSFWDPSVCVGFLLWLAAAAAAAVGLGSLLLAAAAVSRCRCGFSHMLLQCWLAAFVARLCEMVLLSSHVFTVLCLLWESVVFASIEAVTASTASSNLLLLLLMTAVIAATDAVVLFLSLLPAAAGSGAVFVQKTECTRAVVVVSPTRGTKTLRLELPTTQVDQNTDATSPSVAHFSLIQCEPPKRSDLCLTLYVAPTSIRLFDGARSSFSPKRSTGIRLIS